MRAPDLTQRVIGFRQWNIREGTTDLHPVGMTSADPWKSGPQHAVCHSSSGSMRTPCLPVVNDECHCGFYALHHLQDAEGYGGYNGNAVQGIVTGWGRVAIHTDGFRAEWIELMAIIMPPDTPKSERRKYWDVAKAYNVPLMDYDQAEGFAEEFGARVPDSMKPGRDIPQCNEHYHIFPSAPHHISVFRTEATKEANRLKRIAAGDEPQEVPQWLKDVAMEIDPDCPEAMAGLYDIYVPNLGDLLLAIVEVPTPTYVAFPPEEIRAATIDPTRGFSEHICTNGAVAYLPRG